MVFGAEEISTALGDAIAISQEFTDDPVGRLAAFGIDADGLIKVLGERYDVYVAKLREEAPTLELSDEETTAVMTAMMRAFMEGLLTMRKLTP